MSTQAAEPIELLKKALAEDDARLLQETLERHPALKAKINEPVACFNSPVITAARSRQMIDALLAAGADIDAKSTWWAGGFALVHSAPLELARYAIERGAKVDVHAAARLGLVARLREMISASPELVHARGGDGQTPLHFAATVEVADYLLDQGADPEARDVDHQSTPAQYMTGERHEVARALIRRGAKTDLLMAAALGDADLVRRHLAADPACIRMRVSDEYFPMLGGMGGGTIYQWTLGWYVSAHQVAGKFGHQEIYRLLMEASPPEVKLLAACWTGDRDLVGSLLAARADLAAALPEGERRHAAHAARNDDLPALRLMLDAGLPADARGQHGGTPLHWAAFHGNAEMIREVLRYQPPLEWTDHDFRSTPMGWAVHGSENGWHRERGDYAATVKALLQAGAKPPTKPGGSPAVREALS